MIGLLMENSLLVNFLNAGYILSHGLFLDLINGAKMALKCLATYPNMAICGGMSSKYTHI
jgi:hypothetical protein